MFPDEKLDEAARLMRGNPAFVFTDLLTIKYIAAGHVEYENELSGRIFLDSVATFNFYQSLGLNFVQLIITSGSPQLCSSFPN